MAVQLDKCSDQKSRELAQSFDYHVDDFTVDEKGYLDQWLCRNIELEQKARSPKGKIESHMLDMLEGKVPIDKFGVEAYLKWKAAKEADDYGVFLDDDQAPFNDEPFDPAGNNGKALKRYLAQSRYEATRDFLKDLRGRARGLGKRVSEPALWAAAALSTDFSRKFTEWTEWVSQAAPTVYDKSVDAVYNATREGGSELHRLIDQQHDLFAMWRAVKDALPNDSSIDEIGGYFSALWKDMATPQGIPFTSISREDYDALADALNQTFGIPRSWVSDSLTFNATELLASSLGVVALALNWSSEDKERFGEIASTLGIAGAISANPLLGLVALVSLARAFNEGQDKQAYTEVLNGMVKGGIGTGVLIAVTAVISGPAWVGLVVGLCLSIYIRKYTDKVIELADIVDWVTSIIGTKVPGYAALSDAR
jgi:hypothetical protein